MSENIFTQLIADLLDVTHSVALRVKKQMDRMGYVDWSDTNQDEIQVYAMLAFQDLNENYPTNF